MSDQEEPRQCDACGRPAERGGELYVRGHSGPPVRVRVGYYGRECLRATVRDLYAQPKVWRVEHRNGRKARRQS